MAERKPRATKEESLKAKIAANLEAQAKLVAKIEALKVRKPKKQKQRKQRRPRKRRKRRNCSKRSQRAASVWKL